MTDDDATPWPPLTAEAYLNHRELGDLSPTRHHLPCPHNSFALRSPLYF